MNYLMYELKISIIKIEYRRYTPLMLRPPRSISRDRFLRRSLDHQAACEGVKKVRSPLTCVVSSGGSAAGRASGRALPRLTRSLAALGPQSAPSRARGAASSGGIIHPSVPLPRSSAHPPAVRAVPPPAATCRLTLSLTVTRR